MNNNKIFNTLFNGGNITLPYLIEIKNSSQTIRLVNSNKPVQYGGKTYGVSSFEYTEPDINGNGGSLSLTSIDNEVFELIESTQVYDNNYSLSVIGVLIAGEEIQALRNMVHFHGSISMSENMTIEFTLEGDDRKEMQFPPYKFDTDNNPANA